MLFDNFLIFRVWIVVIHHGGAGTVAAGLRFGLPTLVCPFFGDQFMWGYFVELAGVGPKACPINQLDVEKLATSLSELASPAMQGAAKTLANSMAKEDGVQTALLHFYDCLPRDNMLCDVSLLLGECVPARYELVGTKLRQNGIKVSCEVAALLEAENVLDWKYMWSVLPPCPGQHIGQKWYNAGMIRHPVTSLNLSGRVKYLHHGVFAGT
jgi:Glycosyltransferase family 28 C-terminal domain